MRRGGQGAGGRLHSTASGGILSWAGTTRGRCASLAPDRVGRPLRSFASRSPPPLGVGSVRFRPSWGVRLLALTIAGTSTFYFSQSAWLNGLGDEPCYSLDRVRNDKRPVVYSDDYDQNWWGLERLLPLPLTLQDRKYHAELAQGLVEKGVIKADQFIMPEVPTKEDLKEYNTQEYLTSLNQSRRLAQALGNPTLRYFPSLVIHTFVSGFMLEAVGGTVLASRVALERGWAINLGGGFHHASASSGSQGDGFVADFGLDENVYLVDSHTDQPDGGHKRSRACVGASLGVQRQGTPKEEYLRWVATEVEKAITTFRPHMVFYISGSSPADPTQGNPPPSPTVREDWVVDRDALVFRLAVDTHSIPLVMVVSGGWAPGNDPGVMVRSIARILAQR